MVEKVVDLCSMFNIYRVLFISHQFIDQQKKNSEQLLKLRRLTSRHDHPIF